jgi:hypothetical protein
MNIKKIAAWVGAGLLALGSLTACSEIADPDKVGLWYAKGQSDGNQFDHCVKPGQVDDVAVNDEVKWVENNLRTWNAAPTGQGGDTDVPLTLTAKADTAQGQQTGLQVNVWTQTNFMLNTFCGDDERDVNSPLVKWWNNLGDRYDADTPVGWRNMLLNTVVPALEKAKNVLRVYTADELIGGTVWAAAEQDFASTFTTELKRLAGQDYFCGPTFDRTKSDCPSIAVSIKDADLTDPAVQAARNEKQAALEKAQADVARAEGQVAAAKAQELLYSNPAWVQLQIAQNQLLIAQACAASSKCTMVLDSAGGVQVHTS